MIEQQIAYFKDICTKRNPSIEKLNNAVGNPNSDFLPIAWEAAYVLSDIKTNPLGYLLDGIISGYIFDEELSKAISTSDKELPLYNAVNPFVKKGDIEFATKVLLDLIAEDTRKEHGVDPRSSIANSRLKDRDIPHCAQSYLFYFLQEDSESYFQHNSPSHRENRPRMAASDNSANLSFLQYSISRMIIDGKATEFREPDNLVHFEACKSADELNAYIHLFLYAGFFGESMFVEYKNICRDVIATPIFERLSQFWRGFIYWHAGENQKAENELLRVAQSKPFKGYNKMAILLLACDSSLSGTDIKKLIELHGEEAFNNTKLTGSGYLPQKPAFSLSTRKIEDIFRDIGKASNPEARKQLAYELGGSVLHPQDIQLKLKGTKRIFVYYKKKPEPREDCLQAVTLATALLLGIPPEQIQEVSATQANSKQTEYLNDVAHFLNTGSFENSSDFFLLVDGKGKNAKKLLHYCQIDRWLKILQQALLDLLAPRVNNNKKYDCPLLMSYIESLTKVDFSPAENACKIMIPLRYGGTKRGRKSKSPLSEIDELELLKIYEEFKGNKQRNQYKISDFLTCQLFNDFRDRHPYAEALEDFDVRKIFDKHRKKNRPVSS